MVAAPALSKSAGIPNYGPIDAPLRILLMEPDVDVSVITAGGLREPNLEWTQQATDNLIAALAMRQSTVGGTLVDFDESKIAQEERAVVRDLVHLSTAVTFTAATHTVLPGAAPLPTKKGRFDWSLGSASQVLATAFEADYALFLIVNDSFSAPGRVAVNVMGMATCIIGICMIPQGGRQDALASLVDLQTGQLVWIAYSGKRSGDIRERQGAQALIDALLSDMPEAKLPPDLSKGRK